MALCAENFAAFSCWLLCCYGDNVTFAAEDWLLASQHIHTFRVASDIHTCSNHTALLVSYLQPTGLKPMQSRLQVGDILQYNLQCANGLCYKQETLLVNVNLITIIIMITGLLRHRSTDAQQCLSIICLIKITNACLLWYYKDNVIVITYLLSS